MKRFLIIFTVIALALLWGVPAMADNFTMEGDADVFYSEAVHHSLRIGYSVAMGDLNDDGYDDMIVGAPGYYESAAGGASDTGRVYILWGSDTPDDNPDVTIRTDGNQGLYYFRLGYDLAVGDINGDGIDDLLVSAPGAMSYPYGYMMDAGAVFVFYGRTNWDPEYLINPYAYPTPLLADVNIFGEGYTYMGEEIEAGDINDDGRDDVIAAELRVYAPYASNSGRVNVFFGSSSFAPEQILNRNADVDVEVFNPPVDFGLGNGLAAGDVNDDGVDDLLMGAPGSWSPNVKDKIDVTGQIYILNGRSMWSSPIDLATDGYDVRIEGVNNDEANFGFAIAVGDVNGDEIGDVIGGAPEVEAGAPGKAGSWGTVYVVYGSGALSGDILLDTASNRDITINGVDDFPDKISYHFGFALAVGDMNADCIDDILIGGYYRGDFDDRVVFMVYGRDDFAPNENLDMPDDATHTIIDAAGYETNSSMLGNAVAMGDFDHDGLSDMCVGAMGRWGPIDGNNGAAFLVLSPEDYDPVVVDAGPDQEVCRGAEVTLDGTASGGVESVFEWAFVSGPVPIDTSGPEWDTLNPTFMAPDQPGEEGDYIFSLTMHDCNMSETDEVVITVLDCDAPPQPDDDDDAADPDDPEEETFGFFGTGGCGIF